MFRNIIMTGVACALSCAVLAADITLPEANTNGDVSLMQALKNRHSDHAFMKQEIGPQELSNLLWVAYGINRADGKRTIPTARDQKDLTIYVFNPDGIYVYDADSMMLRQVSEENRLDIFKTQEYMNDVSVVFLYTAKNKDYGPMHAGSAYQNVGLYTATNQMASIVRGNFDKQAVREALRLPDDEYVLVSQAIGWKK